MRKAIVVLAVLCIVVISLLYMSQRDEINSRSVVNSYFSAVKSMNYETAYTYVYPRQQTTELASLGRSEFELLKVYLNKMSYKIVNVKQAKGGANVTVDVVVPDAELCMREALSRIPPNAKGDYGLMLFRNMTEIIKQGVPMVTTTRELSVRNRNGRMVIINYNKKLPLMDPRLIKFSYYDEKGKRRSIPY